MVAKTGVARLALSTGAPVIPVAHWGAQDVLPYGSFLPHVLPRRTVQMLAGPPVDLSAFAGQPLTSQMLRAATDKIMADVTAPARRAARRGRRRPSRTTRRSPAGRRGRNCRSWRRRRHPGNLPRG